MEIHPIHTEFTLVTFMAGILLVILCAVWKLLHDRELERMRQSSQIREGPVTKAQAKAASTQTVAQKAEVIRQPDETEPTKDTDHAAAY
jgi:hypothetical protein